MDPYLKKQLMLQEGYVAKSVCDLKTNFTPLDTINTKDEGAGTIKHKIGMKYKSNVTKIFTKAWSNFKNRPTLNSSHSLLCNQSSGFAILTLDNSN
jgi:hypothetical protein